MLHRLRLRMGRTVPLLIVLVALCSQPDVKAATLTEGFVVAADSRSLAVDEEGDPSSLAGTSSPRIPLKTEGQGAISMDAAFATSVRKAMHRRSQLAASVHMTLDQPNAEQVHPPPRSTSRLHASKQDLASLSPVHGQRQTVHVYGQGTGNALRVAPVAQSWEQDPYNNLVKFRLVTWWHIFNVLPLSKYDVVARIHQQLKRTNEHFATGGADYTFDFVFGGATVYNSSESASWICNQPDTYQAEIAVMKPGSRYVNTVVCNRGDKQMGQGSFPYDTNGQAFAFAEDDPRHVMQIDPEALAGGAYGSDVVSSDGDVTLKFNAPVFSHLLGHLFGLPHTFQDNGKCPAPYYDNDDYVGVTDTPMQELPHAGESGCSNDLVDCGEERFPTNAYLLNNIMGHALCADSFTRDQKQRMAAAGIEYHTRKLGRQDCETNPCESGKVCMPSRIGILQGFWMESASYDSVNVLVSVPFLTLADYSPGCTNASIRSAGCVAAATRWCTQNTEIFSGAYIWRQDPSSLSLQIHCVRVGVEQTRTWKQLSSCQYSPTSDIFADASCGFALRLRCPSSAVPLQITPSGVRYSCMPFDSSITDSLPLAALKLYNPACNQYKDFSRQECRDAVMAYGSNDHECVCTNGQDNIGNCKLAGIWQLGIWGDCNSDCTQTRTVVCSNDTDPCAQPQPADSRPCAFGQCTQDVENNQCSSATKLFADFVLLPEERFKPRSTGDDPLMGDYDSSPAWGTACNGSHIAAWYTFQFPFTFNVQFQVRSSSVDTVMSLLQGSCSAISEVVCAATSLPAITSNSLQANVEYFLRVASKNNQAGSFDLAISVTPAGVPAGDECSTGAIISMGSDGYAYVNNTLSAASASTNILPVNICGRSASSPDVWFSYTPAVSGLMIVGDDDENGLPGPTLDLVYTIFEGPCAALKVLQCFDDSASFRRLIPTSSYKRTISAYLSAGSTYLIRMATYNGLRPTIGADSFFTKIQHARSQSHSFAYTTDWGACDASCQQTRTVICNRTRDGAAVSYDWCLTSTMIIPEFQRACVGCVVQGDAPNSCTAGARVQLNNTAGVVHTKFGDLSNIHSASVNTTDDFRAAICYSSRGYRDFWYALRVMDIVEFSASVGAAHPLWVLSIYREIATNDGIPILSFPNCDKLVLLSCGMGALTDVVLEASSAYLLRVARPASDVESFFTLSYSLSTANTNDICSESLLRKTITTLNSTQLSGSINGSFASATPSSGYGPNSQDLLLNPVCGTSVNSKDLWYQFRFDTRGMLQVWIEYAAAFKGAISLHASCSSSARASNCVQYNNDDASPSETDGTGAGRLSYTVSGTSLPSPIIRVATFDSTSPAETFTLRWRFTPSSPKPWRLICSQAIKEVIQQGYGTVQSGELDVDEGVSTKWASPSPSICGASADSQTVWLQYTPLLSGRLEATTFDVGFDTVLSVHKSSTDCAGFVRDDSIIACDDDSGREYASNLVIFVNAGQTYLLRVAGNRNDSGYVSVDFTLSDFQPQSAAYWWRGPWTRCSASCKQTRWVQCLGRADERLPEQLCLASAAKPVEERGCAGEDCTALWRPSAWSECGTLCQQTRTASCQAALQTTYTSAECPVTLTPIQKRVCIGGVCPNVKNDTVVDLELKFIDSFDINLESLHGYLDHFRVASLCPAVLLELPYYDCAGQTEVVSFTFAGRGVIRFRGPNCREALTAALDYVNNGIDAAVFDEKNYFLRHFESPVVDGLPSAAEVFAPVIPSSSSNRDRNIGLGVGIGVGGFLLIAGAVAGGVYYFKKRRSGGARGGAGADVPMSSTASSAAYPV